MAATTRATLAKQLPTWNPWTVERTLNGCGAVTSIIAFLLIFVNIGSLSSDVKIIIAITYLFLIIVFLIAYILLGTQKQLQRYAQAVFHMHFVNHAIRDHLAARQSDGENVPLKDHLGQILDAIAGCYSVLTGRPCRVSIKEIKPGSPVEVTTAMRDSISRVSSNGASSENKHVVHALDKNTDFRNLWYCQNGCFRYYFSNNIIDDWKNGDYENTSFEVYGRPKGRTFFFKFTILHWTLPYKSVMVFPIRYVRDWSKWPLLPGTERSSTADAPQLDDQNLLPDVWGFLCVDSPTKGAFRLPHAAEVGGAFADALYTLFTTQAKR